LLIYISTSARSWHQKLGLKILSAIACRFTILTTPMYSSVINSHAGIFNQYMLILIENCPQLHPCKWIVFYACSLLTKPFHIHQDSCHVCNAPTW